MKSYLKIFSSLAVGVLCTALVARGLDGPALKAAFSKLSPSALALYGTTLAVTHFFRAVRWRYLLRAIGVELSQGRLLAISSVGFMAILALPFRLGEFVRPYFVIRQKQTRMSEVLGTVAVERIVDGLLVSSILVLTYILAPEAFGQPVGVLGGAPLRGFAWLSLGLFAGATGFLVAALLLQDRAVGLFLKLSGLNRFAPKFAARIGDRLLALIRGFQSLRQPRNLLPFLAQSIVYWGSNGLGMWLLARSMGFPLTPVAAFAAMAFTGVVISLPNSPGLVGQFHLGVVAVAVGFLGDQVGHSAGLAYAIVLHAAQTVWYVGVGLIAFRFTGGRKSSFREVVSASSHVAEPTG
jgi:glycosyltransferase 2 family protein